MLRLAQLNLFLISLAVLGCSEDGPKRYRISGKVTIDGAPIPYGEVILTPDISKKNSGPQGKAPISNGQFDTNYSGGLGIAGGPTVVRVNGMSGPGGKTLCEYEIMLDLPTQSSSKDLDIPGKEAHNANPQGAGKAKNSPEI